jgi:hypothetical protein
MPPTSFTTGATAELQHFNQARGVHQRFIVPVTTEQRRQDLQRFGGAEKGAPGRGGPSGSQVSSDQQITD